jgi:hypothetical protein
MIDTRRLASAVATILCATSLIQARQTDPARALQNQIDRIFQAREFEPPRFGPARWLPDGTAYTIVERDKTRGTEIARFDAATGTRGGLLVVGRRPLATSLYEYPEGMAPEHSR